MDGPASADDGIFGLPGSERAARLVYLPVPWEVTTSYGGGTSNGPSAIREASPQLDLYDEEVERPYAAGLYMRRESARVRRWNFEAKMAAQSVIASLTAGKKASPKALSTVNAFGDKLNAWVYEETRGIIAAGKVPALIGGDHSTPYGAIRAAVEKWPGLGLLHFDAHHDTREAYEGFTWSHASIFFNVMRRLPVRKIVQVGIRDYSAAERAFCRNLKDRCAVFYDEDLKRRRFSGEPFHTTAREIVSELPSDVWVTFDIDGLDPRYCPGTGTPVPGGLEFSEANHILRTLVASKRRIVGFDLNEVAPLKGSEWDANVGARLLYKMTAWTLASQGLAKSSLR
ncbi:MAG: agmatinase family protein [Elusimicrobia bacterium]|nr:agmatinase family protein [Elusimicrobiota bacterium]